MPGFNPLILSSSDEDKNRFRQIIEGALEASLTSFDNSSAFSGIDPYELRKKVESLGFLPEEGLGYDKCLEKVKEDILPHLLRTWSSDYMPHLHAPALTETIAAELIIAIFNDSMDSWDQGPSATELEESVIHGLVDLYGLGKDADGTFTSGGTQSNLCAILSARDWYCNTVLKCDVKKDGLPEQACKMRLYASEVSHFSMEKSCHFIGLGYNAVRKIPVDDQCRVDIRAFEKMLEEDKKAGLLPFCAVATIGTTDFGSIDSIEEMRKLCDKYHMHLHADAAYGSAAIMSAKYRERLGNTGLCDSITVDFHKMFLLPISCSVILYKNKKLEKCFELHADYLNREEDEEEGYINLVDKSMQTTRRFDALKVFMAFQTRGRKGFENIINTVIGNAEYFYGKLSCDPDFYVPVKPQLSTAVFARVGSDELNKRIRKTLLKKGIVIGQTSMNGKTMLKFTLLNPSLTHEKIDELIATIKEI